MAFYDVEALLDATAKQDEKMEDAPPVKSGGTTPPDGDDAHQINGKDESSDRRSRDKSRERDGGRDRDRSRDRKRRDRDRDRSKDRFGSRRGSPDSARTPRSEAGSHRSSRRRSRSRDRDRADDRHSRRNRDRDGDYYRGGRGGQGRSRSRSPGGRFYRPRDDRRDYRDRRDRRDDDRRAGGRTPRADRGDDRQPTPAQLTEDERDRRTVFVQQLAARLRTRDLKEFFEKVGPVSEAQIVKDRVSNRSKGYVIQSPGVLPTPLTNTANVYSVSAMLNSSPRTQSLLLFSLPGKSS